MNYYPSSSHLKRSGVNLENRFLLFLYYENKYGIVHRNPVTGLGF